jgi:hypothetical protein
VSRGGSDLRRALTFGGQAPLSVGALILAMVVATALGGLVRNPDFTLALRVPPGRDPAGLLQVWRLATWPFPQPLQGLVVLDLLFGGISLLWLGRQLSFAWSERRFLLRFFTLTVGAALLTEAILWPLGFGYAYAGIWPIVNALLVTWGLIFPRQQLAWFGAVQMSGATVAQVFTFGTPVYALVMGGSGFIPARLLEFLPHLAALGLAWLLVAGGPRRGWYRLTDWWRRRDLEAQRRKFKVISTDRPRPKPKEWMN